MTTNQVKTYDDFSFDDLLREILFIQENDEQLRPIKALLKALQSQYNKNVEDYNKLQDKYLFDIDHISAENLNLFMSLEAIKKTAAEETEHAKAQYDAKGLELQKVNSDLKAVNHELSKLRKEEKRNKTQISRLKESNTTLKGKLQKLAKSNENEARLHKLVDVCNAMREELMGYHQSDSAVNIPSYIAPIHNLYSSNNCHVLLIDKPQRIEVANGEHIFQYPLLFAHSCGTYYTYCLSGDDRENPEFLISSGVFSNGIDKQELEKYEVKVPKEIEQAMEKWLIKVNITQDCILEKSDYALTVK